MKYKVSLYDGSMCMPSELVEQCTLDTRVIEAKDINAPEINEAIKEMGSKYVRDMPYFRCALIDPGVCHCVDFGSHSKFIQIKEIK